MQLPTLANDTTKVDDKAPVAPLRAGDADSYAGEAEAPGFLGVFLQHTGSDSPERIHPIKSVTGPNPVQNADNAASFGGDVSQLVPPNTEMPGVKNGVVRSGHTARGGGLPALAGDGGRLVPKTPQSSERLPQRGGAFEAKSLKTRVEAASSVSLDRRHSFSSGGAEDSELPEGLRTTQFVAEERSRIAPPRDKGHGTIRERAVRPRHEHQIDSVGSAPPMVFATGLVGGETDQPVGEAHSGDALFAGGDLDALALRKKRFAAAPANLGKLVAIPAQGKGQSAGDPRDKPANSLEKLIVAADFSGRDARIAVGPGSRDQGISLIGTEKKSGFRIAQSATRAGEGGEAPTHEKSLPTTGNNRAAIAGSAAAPSLDPGDTERAAGRGPDTVFPGKSQLLDSPHNNPATTGGSSGHTLAMGVGHGPGLVTVRPDSPASKTKTGFVEGPHDPGHVTQGHRNLTARPEIALDGKEKDPAGVQQGREFKEPGGRVPGTAAKKIIIGPDGALDPQVSRQGPFLPAVDTQAAPPLMPAGSAHTHAGVFSAAKPVHELAHTATRQIVHSLRHETNGSVVVQLRPEELGHVHMKISTEHGGLSVALSIDRSDTLDLMRRHVDILGQELRRLGYTSVDFTFSGNGSGYSGGGNAGGNTHQATPDSIPDSPSGTRSQNSEGLQHPEARPTEGVDIRV